MSLEENIQRGKRAIREVKSMNILASNKVGDRLKAAGGIENVVGHGYDWTAHDGVENMRAATGSATSIADLQNIVATVRGMGYGNCGEQAIVTFMFLYEQDWRPLDLMCFDPTVPGYDHCWVVIGLDAAWERDNLRSWGPEAVWCDPWQGDGVVFAISDFVKGAVRNLNANYNCDTYERVEAGKPQSLLRVV